ncbi:nitroreductase [Clostridium sp. MCC353]|uniref:nitroreductase family protein n=1 Tax=Clostridium sp. MCC353 TaxID=2592646 RepID=UPI001C032C0E|nr:nitroreductase family protein [Clostridium sp. MCC353]MBT9778535.1 nitroreductase [Clostridium sp. MCC353]
MIKAIEDRRSIRKYKTDKVPQAIIEEILKAGILAPSSKNRQPWKFTVVTGDSKDEMISVMEIGLEREEREPLLPGSSKHLMGAEHTLAIMNQAPVIIFITNPLGLDMNLTLSAEDRIYEICNAQSVGAAIENMTLTAAEAGLGSLWICDTYFAYKELCDWLGTGGELFAALAIGYADEAPSPRPRKDMVDVVEWRD